MYLFQRVASSLPFKEHGQIVGELQLLGRNAPRQHLDRRLVRSDGSRDRQVAAVKVLAKERGGDVALAEEENAAKLMQQTMVIDIVYFLVHFAVTFVSFLGTL